LNRNISKSILYGILLISFLIIQTRLKEMPQIAVISIAITMVLLNRLEQIVMFRVFNFILLLIFIFCFVFQSIYLLRDWVEPNRGISDVNGKMVHIGMDISGIFVGFFSFIIATIGTVVNLNNNKYQSIKIENYLAIATLISSSLIFIYFELI
jgi:hypothetical protein